MSRPSGFTLLELMMALAIVALLASFSVPSYRQHIAQGHRAAAVSALYRAAHYLETFDGALPSALPDSLAHAPPDGRAVYRLEIRRPNEGAFAAYRIDARPLDDGPMRDDPCGTFTLRGDGTKGNLRANGEDEWDPACWGVR